MNIASRRSKSKIWLLFSILLQLGGVMAKFRSSLKETWSSDYPIWANYTEVNRTHESIKVAWEPV